MHTYILLLLLLNNTSDWQQVVHLFNPLPSLPPTPPPSLPTTPLSSYPSLLFIVKRDREFTNGCLNGPLRNESPVWLKRRQKFRI